MIVYRISSYKYANDLSGTGAKLYGGRWNLVGYNVVYTSENISLCMLEILVHANRSQLNAEFVITKIEIPQNFSIKTIDGNLLPKNWNIYPQPISTQNLGSNWLESQDSLLLKVPSSANPFETNILINPNHREFSAIRILETKPFRFEQRLIKVGQLE